MATPHDATMATEAAYWRKISTWCVIFLYLLSALLGAVYVTRSNNAPIRILGSVSFAVAVTCWAIADTRVRARPMLRIVQVIFLFTWPVAAPLYLVVSRGWRGLGLALLHGFGLFMTLQLTFYPTYFLLYFWWQMKPDR